MCFSLFVAEVTGLTSQVDKMQLAIKEGQKDNSPKAADIERLVQRQISHVQSQVQTAVTSCSQVDVSVLVCAWFHACLLSPSAFPWACSVTCIFLHRP